MEYVVIADSGRDGLHIARDVDVELRRTTIHNSGRDNIHVALIPAEADMDTARSLMHTIEGHGLNMDEMIELLDKLKRAHESGAPGSGSGESAVKILGSTGVATATPVVIAAIEAAPGLI